MNNFINVTLADLLEDPYNIPQIPAVGGSVLISQAVVVKKESPWV